MLQQRAELEEWKHQLFTQLRNTSIATTPVKGKKREGDSTEDTSNDIAEPQPAAKRLKLAVESECNTCFEVFPNLSMARLKCCKVLCCKDCFRQWFEVALTSKELPKCCGIEIAPAEYAKYLDVETLKKHETLVAEINARRRLQCSNPACRTSIQVSRTLKLQYDGKHSLRFPARCR